MIARILIRQLYDTYNYDIQFPENQRVTIITGPNGYGKTTFLKIINNLLTCNFWFFYILEIQGNSNILPKWNEYIHTKKENRGRRQQS